ncbi:hypothetical protein [Flavobacterium branchiophilum]|uniref:Uncharacterized protein n=1 Tax=Flavobacterium branchiophilum TaxID=55197 RepID=A0A2H3KJY2_9FLAO|nr:hypothetical protein [Flavobacterium branchiophilum]PDS25223.1 hypothetical protein B0A77_05345 [Flavobacterium branchiophilum]
MKQTLELNNDFAKISNASLLIHHTGTVFDINSISRLKVKKAESAISVKNIFLFIFLHLTLVLYVNFYLYILFLFSQVFIFSKHKSRGNFNYKLYIYQFKNTNTIDINSKTLHHACEIIWQYDKIKSTYSS